MRRSAHEQWTCYVNDCLALMSELRAGTSPRTLQDPRVAGQLLRFHRAGLQRSTLVATRGGIPVIPYLTTVAY